MSLHPRSISHPCRAILLNICRSSRTSPLPFWAKRAAGDILSQKKNNYQPTLILNDYEQAYLRRRIMVARGGMHVGLKQQREVDKECYPLATAEGVQGRELGSLLRWG